MSLKRSPDLYRHKAKIVRNVTTNVDGRMSNAPTTLHASIPCSWQDDSARRIGSDRQRAIIEAPHTHRIFTYKNVSDVKPDDHITNLKTDETLIVCSVKDQGDRGEGWCIYARSN